MRFALRTFDATRDVRACRALSRSSAFTAHSLNRVCDLG